MQEIIIVLCVIIIGMLAAVMRRQGRMSSEIREQRVEIDYDRIAEAKDYREQLDKIASVIGTYIKAIELWIEQVDLVIGERNRYSQGLLNEATFANKSSVIDNLETLQKVLREIKG